jgi:MoaA/NifB/PqqE/SkfB family radical SAM enzyme
MTNNCIAPWVHLHTWPNNNVYPCCLTDSSDPVGNLNKNTLAEIWNGNPMKTLRKELLEGKRPITCSRCFENEDVGQNSLRQHLNNVFEHHTDLWNKTNEDGSLDDLSIYYWDFRFSNICNMKCRSCGPQLSTGWYEDQKKMWGSLPNDLPDPGKNINMWSEIEPLFPTVEDIYFAGGEPLLMEEHYRILKKLDEMQKYDTIIRYNTNFSRLKYKQLDVLDVWPKFKKVIIGASLDGYGEQAEYIRKGTNWEQIEKNRSALRDRAPNAEFFINCTISVQNAYHIVDFYKYCIETDFCKPWEFRTNIVQHPEHLRLQILPKNIKEELTNLYNTTADYADSLNGEHVGNDFRSLAVWMNQEDRSNDIKIFKEQMDIVDSIRNEKFSTTFPQLAELVK